MKINLKRWGTQWAVWFYMILFAGLLAIEATSTEIIPMEAAIYALMMILGSYIGVDQVSTFVASKSMPVGQKYTGSLHKLRNVTIVLCLLVAEALVVQYIIKPRVLPLDTLFFCCGLILSLYVGGNKAANIAENMGSKKEETKN